jgi:hypothetical protein
MNLPGFEIDRYFCRVVPPRSGSYRGVGAFRAVASVSGG